ncbi:hypothetical protein MTR67_038402 [Solanum verrucosum]|uniref:Uncharacterized protein n=1 Tax=Solanum verrucosum TaxID=315347 RepID=A0AAF0ZMR2_SOLVR|nr:hypothetical protein MTR67_038402 [Solanum verrucosum]
MHLLLLLLYYIGPNHSKLYMMLVEWRLA